MQNDLLTILLIKVANTIKERSLGFDWYFKGFDPAWLTQNRLYFLWGNSPAYFL